MSFVLLDVADGVAELTINRPEKRNALSWPLVRELRATWARVAGDDSIKVLLVRGAGDIAFSAGADYREMAGATVEDDEAFCRDFMYMVHELAQLPQPTVGAVAGYAYGGGAELATALDVRLGAPTTRFRYPGAVLGRVTGAQRLPQIVGTARAKELVFTARVVEAEEAERIGLLNRVLRLDRLFDEARAVAGAIAANQPLPLRLAKAAINDTFGATPQEAFERELAAELECVHSHEIREAFGAAFESQLKRRA